MRRSTDFAFVAFAAFLVAGASACGGGEFTARAGDAGAPISQVQACGDNAHSHCLELQKCSTELLTSLYGDEGTCETRLKLTCLNALAAPSTGGSAAHTEACAQAYPAWTCPDYLDDNPPAACVQALGSRGNGQTCAFPGQCQAGFCKITPGSMCGVCAPVPRAGDSCASMTTCGQLLACDTSVHQCSSFAPAGAACKRGELCGAGLYCVGSTSTASGICMPAVSAAGATCDPSGKSGPGCDRLAGFTCNSTTNQCAGIEYSDTGQPCGSGVNGQFAACANAGACLAAAGADASTGLSCTPTAADGAPCDLVNGPFCRDPARCIFSGDAGTAGTCQFPNALACQ